MSSLSKNNKIADQHIYLDKNQLLEIEQKIRIQRHIERYALLRQFAKGVVCDAACGCGYGSYLLSTNPDVNSVIGLDSNSDIIDFANREYRDNKTQFFNVNINEWMTDKKIDMLFSVETIEHIEYQDMLPNFCDRKNINHVIWHWTVKEG